MKRKRRPCGRLLEAEQERRLDLQHLRDALAVEVGVAPEELGALLAAEEELDDVVLGEADTAVDLLAVGDHAAAGVASTRPWPWRCPCRRESSFSLVAQAALYMMKRMPSTSVTMSAALCWMAWNEPIGRPNWTRSLA